MCYDITNYDSFQNLDDWYRLVVRTFVKGTMPYVAMVGNKCEAYILYIYKMYHVRYGSLWSASRYSLFVVR